ncbi:MAG: xanthine dehydrogenase family protein subunit M [Burkholderiales bacterium]
MNRFGYHRAENLEDALRALNKPGARAIAGGTNLVDLMKYEVERPALLIDISRLPLAAIDEIEGGGLRLGALASNADTAHDPRVAERYPLLASAILAGASAQLRNAATNGGNLLQRTRCYYFYDVGAPACNKRDPGSGCGAIGGVNRIHAILGASDACIATHPSDMCVALAALDAQVVVQSAKNGERRIAFADFHRLPGDTPEHDHNLEAGDLITAIELPPCDFGPHHTYLKLRDRQSYAFALVSCAVGLQIEHGTVRRARIALGGVAHKPWRDPAAENLLEGAAPTEATFATAADALLEGARGQGANDFKIPLAYRAIVRALSQAAAGTPQQQAVKSIN